MNRNKWITLVGLGMAALLGGALPVGAQSGMYPDQIEIMVDVAEDMDKYVEHNVKAGEEPVRGSYFVTEGNVFAAGTIPGAGEQFDPNSGGSLGTWFCKGVFLVRGSVMDKSPMAVLSDQIFLLPDDKQSVVTAGSEGNGVSMRTVVGGTGRYAGYVGEQRQEFLGFNKTGGVNLRVKISLRRAVR